LKKYLGIFLLFITILFATESFAQHPQYFLYDDESSLPSNEVYSIVQDNHGFIWLGCNVGLYMFDGVGYINYSCQSQKSKSITGLTFSSSNRLYCYNFQSQIFYIENDTLKELYHTIPKIFSIAADKESNIWFSHELGISRYNERTKEWHLHSNFGKLNKDAPIHFTNSVMLNSDNEICFLNTEGIGKISNKKINIVPLNDFEHQPPGRFMMESWNNILFVIATDGSALYEDHNNTVHKNSRIELVRALVHKKITNVKTLADGMLWICTYTGIIRYNPQIDQVTIYYPYFAFSDVIIDREQNYWFTTLHAGILRVPDMEFLVWQTNGDHTLNKKLSRITGNNTHLFFTTVDGKIVRMELFSGKFKTFDVGINADIQCFEYDSQQQCLLFYIGRDLYALKNDKISLVQAEIPSLKSILKAKENYFWLSSTGTFIHSFGKQWKDKLSLTPDWSREAKYDQENNIVWIATNNGLQHFVFKENKWILNQVLLKETQILALDFNNTTKQLFFLSFKGNIFEIEPNNNEQLIFSLPNRVQAHGIKFHDEKLYIPSNKGLWIFDIENKTFESLNTLNGIASDNVLDIYISENHIWLATGKGLQRIPININKSPKPALIYLKNKNENENLSDIKLNYQQSLVLYPQVSSYSSNGKFEYAYRINNQEWLRLPSTIEQLEIQNIPSGKFTVTLKAIDHLEKDSQNTITISGYIYPPFWQTWWFISSILLLISVLIFIIVKKAIANIRIRESQKTALIQTEHTALKAQMNPHFMYNALNSIQALILKQDIKNSNLYLSQFSSLMRKVLDVSGKEEIVFKEETEMLQLYLSLEKLRFGNDFTFKIEVSKEIDEYTIMLPPLIIQPFVENALKHGLLHKKGEKELQINFQKQDNYLICSILDNGIGRKHAQQIKERQKEMQTSFSTRATQKRIQLLNTVNNQNIELEIKDLYKNEQACGTHVLIKIPL
jgi:ligand-binding sensor domain-containing protein/two-component sensor histidine kinase